MEQGTVGSDITEKTVHRMICFDAKDEVMTSDLTQMCDAMATRLKAENKVPELVVLCVLFLDRESRSEFARVLRVHLFEPFGDDIKKLAIIQFTPSSRYLIVKEFSSEELFGQRIVDLDRIVVK